MAQRSVDSGQTGPRFESGLDICLDRYLLSGLESVMFVLRDIPTQPTKRGDYVKNPSVVVEEAVSCSLMLGAVCLFCFVLHHHHQPSS